MVDVLNNLAVLEEESGRRAQSLAHLEEATATLESLVGPYDSALIRPLANLAVYRGANREYARAEALFTRAITLTKDTLGIEHPLYSRLLGGYAGLLRQMKRKNEAKALERQMEALEQSHANSTPGRHTIDVADLALR
jgi:tetratricopeptide (TPR) repeat protein